MEVHVKSISPNPAKERIVFSFPPSFFINFLASFKLSVKNIALVDSDTPSPSKIPPPIAITFFKEPQSSTPIKSLVGLNFSLLLHNAFSTHTFVLLFVVASDKPTSSSVTMSFAKVGPDNEATFLVLSFFFTISDAKWYDSCSIPFEAIKICLSFINGFILSQTLDINFIATAITTRSLPSIAFSTFSV